MGLGLIADQGAEYHSSGLSSSLLMLGTLWILNAFFPGAGDVAVVPNPHSGWYSLPSAVWMVDVETSHNVGGALIHAAGGFISLHQLALRRMPNLNRWWSAC